MWRDNIAQETAHEDYRRAAVALGCLVAVLSIGALVHIGLWNAPTKGEDIYYLWEDGSRILHGENPYLRILAGNMHENQKYSTYFPVFNGISALTQWAGLGDFEPWVAFWRVVFLAFNLGIAGLLYALLYRHAGLLGAIFGAAFWLFNRWTLHVTQIAHLDFVPLFLAVLSLVLFRTHRSASLLLFSLSLGIKQIGIFLAPLYLIWVWQAADRDRVKQVLLAALMIASVPVAASLPFFAWGAPGHPLSGVEGLVKSIVFSATRDPG